MGRQAQTGFTARLQPGEGLQGRRPPEFALLASANGGVNRLSGGSRSGQLGPHWHFTLGGRRQPASGKRHETSETGANSEASKSCPALVLLGPHAMKSEAK